MDRKEFTTPEQWAVSIDETQLYHWMLSNTTSVDTRDRDSVLDCYLAELGFDASAHFLSQGTIMRLRSVYGYVSESKPGRHNVPLIAF